MTRVEKLISIGSEALGVGLESLSARQIQGYPRGPEILEMLREKNGFYAFEQALHVFPIGSDGTGTMTLDDWNSATLWRNAYAHLADGLLFFAEDIFGDQFCVTKDNGAVSRFASETGEISAMAESLEDWAKLILSDYEVETGWPLAHEWQVKNGPLQLEQRLQPKIPFVYGGNYGIDNLWAGDAVKGMLFKGDLALKVKDLPDGTRVRLQVR